jgi:hypothetical protein
VDRSASFPADPDPASDFPYFDADLDPHPTPSFIPDRKSYCFSFHRRYWVLASIFKFYEKNIVQHYILVEMNADPDPALDPPK